MFQKINFSVSVMRFKQFRTVLTKQQARHEVGSPYHRFKGARRKINLILVLF